MLKHSCCRQEQPRWNTPMTGVRTTPFLSEKQVQKQQLFAFVMKCSSSLIWHPLNRVAPILEEECQKCNCSRISVLLHKDSALQGWTGSENSNDKCSPWVEQELGLARVKEPSLSHIKQETSETTENLQIFLQILSSCKSTKTRIKCRCSVTQVAVMLLLLCVPDPCCHCSRTE